MKLTRLLCGLVVALAAFGADVGDWAAVARIVPGTPVEVISGQLQRTSGRILRATADEIAVETGQGASVIARPAVRRVSLLRGSRQRRVLLGTAIGAAVGAAALSIWAGAGDIDIRRDYVVGAGLAVGAAAGAGVGAATAGPVTIYRAR